MVNEEDSRFCSNCGALLVAEQTVKEVEDVKEKAPKKGVLVVVAAVAIIVVAVVGGYFVVFGVETERADELVSMGNQEISQGNSLYNSMVSPKLSEFRKANVDLEKESEINQEISTVKGWRNDAQDLMRTIDEVSNHFENAKGYYMDAKELRLPGWYDEYIGLKIQAVEKDLERMAKVRLLLGNYVAYYGFAENYLNGEKELEDVLDDIGKGNKKLKEGDFDGAVSFFESALEGIKDSKGEYGAAGELIDLDYVDDVDTYLDDLDSALETLVDAVELLDSFSFLPISSLVEKVSGELGIVEGLSDEVAELSERALEGQLDSWYDVYIKGLISEIDDLLREVQRLEQQAENLYEANT
jgi:tetratricopeptide (TPR) repeat protein